MKFSLRDLFWLTAVVALAIGWSLDHPWKSGQKPDTSRICVLSRIVVVAVRHDEVEISIGSDDGLKIGDVLQVYRPPGKYLGQITIRMMGPDRALGQIDRILERGPIQTGDLATSM